MSEAAWIGLGIGTIIGTLAGNWLASVITERSRAKKRAHDVR